jgi:hypothetical protein
MVLALVIFRFLVRPVFLTETMTSTIFRVSAKTDSSAPSLGCLTSHASKCA